MATRTTHRILFAVATLSLAGCVDHRPIRNGLRDEGVYLTKSELTAPNPKLPAEAADDGWLFKTTVVKASSPNVLGDYAFPGFESDLQYVKFRFAEERLQILDGRRLQQDDATDENDDLATTAERVMLEFEGEHVDVKLRESLDGERTNLLEENFEAPWRERQKFRVDFEKPTLDPITSMAWFYGDFVEDCTDLVSTNLVPGSFEWNEEEQYMSFVVEATYKLVIEGRYGVCYDLVSLAHDVGTSTIQYRLSFHRPGATAYRPVVLEEKDPVQKKYGAFQILNTFRDERTGLLGAQQLLQRWNPDREEPVTYYFHEGFPPKFKPMFEEITAETNRVLEESGAKLRVRVAEWNEGGIERHLGDVRHSFVVWHQDIDTTRGLLGYGPSTVDPRTGEVLSANVHLYNVGMDYYRFLIEDYLETFGAPGREDETQPWDQIACEPSARLAPTDDAARLRSTLFDEMRRVMDLPEPAPGAASRDDFIPTPIRGWDAFLADYQRTLGEVRYVEPGYNQYVYRTAKPNAAKLRERMEIDGEFQTAMESVLHNQNPYGTTNLYSRTGLEAQNEFSESFRAWRKNRDELAAERDMLLGRENIFVFDQTDALQAVSTAARRCTPEGFWESDDAYRERIVEDVVFHVAIHEFGHTMSLRHNFYGSLDAAHMGEGEVSASVMDYVRPYHEVGSGRAWGGYDEAALKWIYGTPDVQAAMLSETFLFCTDEHRFRSPLCTAHDLGVTPSQIVLNSIETYDWLYEIRNRRAFRTFWDTGSYVGQVYDAIFPLQRMWYLSIFDWGGGGVQDLLKRIDQVDPERTVLSDPEYDEIALDFYNDAMAANAMIVAFYDAVINQPASFRNYQTEFDPYYGDVLRLGIIIDKLFTSYAFMDLTEVSNYNPNIETYVAMYDAPFGTQNAALSRRVLDDMLGANYDTFPWFRYLAVNLFASATNTNLVGTVSLRERIAIRRYENEEDLARELGDGVIEEATAADNPAQLFVRDGEEFAYAFLADRGWHLVASRSRSPVSFQFVKDYNEALNAGADPDLDTYGLKVLLAYYEFYNNFTGF